MITNKPEDKPKVIALAIALLAAFAFIGSTMFRFNSDKKEEVKRTRNANLMIQMPSINESAGSMIMWRTAKWPIPDPFRSTGTAYVRPDPVYSAPPPRQDTGPSRPVVPVVKANVRGPQPVIVLKGVILSDSGLGSMAVFTVGDVTKTMRSGQPVVPGLILGEITPEGVSIKDLGKSVTLSVNESYKPID